MTEFQQPALHPMNILMAIDDSDHSMAAARFLGSMPLPSVSEVVTVIPATADQTSGSRTLPAILNKVETILWARGIRGRTVVLLGEPTAELTKLVSQQHADLIVIGARSLQPELGSLMGGVAQQMAGCVICPVLVIRAPCSRVRRVLLVTDGSPQSDQAVSYLARFPLPVGAKVTVIHVMPPMPVLNNLIHDRPFTEEMIAPLTMDDVNQIRRQTAAEERMARAILARAVETLKISRVPASIMLLRGDAAEEILWYAQAHKFDLIVTGLAMTERPLESVAGKLVHSTSCPVLVVRQPVIEALTGPQRQADVEH